MVSQYLPYQEYAISEQTGRRRMMFEENSGLGIVVPHNVIQETVKIARDKLRPREQAVSNPEEENA